MASLIGRVENLVVEDGEIQREAKPDRMRRGEVRLGNLRGILVRLQGLVGRLLALIAGGKLGQITVVISLPVSIRKCASATPRIHLRVAKRRTAHLVVKNLGFAALSRGDQMLVEHLQDVLTDLGELILDLLTVLLDQSHLRLVAF